MKIRDARWVRGDLSVHFSWSWAVKKRLTAGGWTFVYDRAAPVCNDYDVVFYNLLGTYDYFTPKHDAVRLWMQMNFPEVRVIS